MINASSNAVRPRPRLVIISYACSPYYGSEPGTGWNYAFEQSKYFDTWVICEGRQYAEDIRRFEAENGPVDGLHFDFVNKASWEPLTLKLPFLRNFAFAISHNLWHRRATRRARELHDMLDFDAALKTTFCSYREPGYVWELGIPFVWGPFGGTQNFPTRFRPMMGLKCTLFESFRAIANWIQLRTSRRVRDAANAASTIVAANPSTARNFAKVHRVPMVAISDVGIHRIASAKQRFNEQGPLRLLWCGVIEPHKALPILLKALGEIKDVPVHVSVLGQGSRKAHWQRLAKRLGIEDRITWLGQLSHDAALEQFRNADAFAFTSLRDTTGTVCVEAIAAGLPVICFDHQGVGDIINENCGIKIPVDNPKSATQNWAAAIRRLATDSKLVEQLSQGARQRAQDYLWSRNGRRMAHVLFRAMGLDPDKELDEASSFEPSDEHPQQQLQNLGSESIALKG